MQQIQGRGAAFVAILQGSSVSSVVAWGNPYIILSPPFHQSTNPKVQPPSQLISSNQAV